MVLEYFFQEYLIPLLCLYGAAFLGSIFLKRNDVADPVWGIAGAFIAYLSYQNLTDPTLGNTASTVAVILWGGRLGGYIAYRHIGKPEDRRYAVWRQSWGKWFYIRSFFQVYLVQMVLILIVCAPIIMINRHPFPPETTGLFILLAFWAGGFIYETVADWQKLQFKKDPSRSGQFIKSGLWAYSRHPNYFGELVQWWSLALIAIYTPYGVISFMGVATLTFLLVKVSGVPMAEERLKTDPDYDYYCQTTPSIIPDISILKIVM